MLKSISYIHFIKPGAQCSVQDQGRFGYADFGVPYSGVMDRFSFFQANMLLGNPENAAVLEIAMLGPIMVFEMPTRIVFTGAIAEIYHNSSQIQMGQVVNIAADDEIRVGKIIHGQWLYMAIEGGLESPVFMDSRSWFADISEKSRIAKGDSISYLYEDRYHSNLLSHPKLDGLWFEDETLDVFQGPEWQELPEDIQLQILQTEFEISPVSNRMGIQLKNPMPNQLEQILTSPVYPGTVQLTPSGKLIVLMRDAQVTGGYPRILQLSDHAINIISQKNFGEKVMFSILES
ncbi:biotin-dependent carboxyltransferase family protein [Belliella marina]|uniref:Biotin-dependent carboxyltransferase family protein n=1 Tax=Belliella marina TaxID=1644146 RepID=A0ABW4VN35_9BACT